MPQYRIFFKIDEESLQSNDMWAEGVSEEERKEVRRIMYNHLSDQVSAILDTDTGSITLESIYD